MVSVDFNAIFLLATIDEQGVVWLLARVEYILTRLLATVDE
jgi:hypothetical protein